MSARPQISIALPAYNEVGNIEAVIDEARAVLATIPGFHEILVVDDGSTDGTGEILDRMAGHGLIRLVRHERNRGFSGAMRSCFANARGEWLFLAPSDGQVPLSVLPSFIDVAAAARADVVVGRRKQRAEGSGRAFLSWCFHRIATLLFDLPLPEFSSCFLFRRYAVIGPWRSRPDAATILPEVLFRARRRGLRMTTVGFEHLPRRSGRAKGSSVRVAALSLLEMLRLAVILRRDRSATTGDQE